MDVTGKPYRVQFGHWGITASDGDPRWPRILGYVGYPVGAQGPCDGGNIKDRCLAELDAIALAALANDDRGDDEAIEAAESAFESRYAAEHPCDDYLGRPA